MITFDTNRLRNAVGFTMTAKVWGNRRKADMSQVTTDADKRRMKLSKELIEAEEYEAIKSYIAACRNEYLRCKALILASQTNDEADAVQFVAPEVPAGL